MTDTYPSFFHRRGTDPIRLRAGACKARILAAPDSLKGSATATEVAGAIALGAAEAGYEVDQCPLSDGGDGFVDVMSAALSGGAENTSFLRTTMVSGPLGAPVQARWYFDGEVAIIESAQACGLVLAGGPSGNDPIKATTRGVGELIMAALGDGAQRVLVGVGGTASTDGGAGALEVIEDGGGFGRAGVQLQVACDVDTGFTDAASVYGPQKGATDEQVHELECRLERQAQRYLEEKGIDLEAMPGAGAGGGLAGGLGAIGATLRPGFDVVAEHLELARRIRRADLVVTSEGTLDATSWRGKVVGGVSRLAAAENVPVIAVVGRIGPGVGLGPHSVVGIGSLVEAVGEMRSLGNPSAAVTEVVSIILSRWVKRR